MAILRASTVVSLSYSMCDAYLSVYLLTSHIQIHVVVSLGNALHVGSRSCLYEFTELDLLSFGSQLPPRTSNILID